MRLLDKFFLLVVAISLISCSKEATDVIIEPPYTVFHTPKQVSFRDFTKEAVLGFPETKLINEEVFDRIHLLFGIDNDKKVWVYDITYPSTGLQGEKLLLSARVYIPVKAFLGETVEATVLANHHLITASRYCPTQVCVFESLPAWLDCIVVVPDLIGLGASVDQNMLSSDANFNSMGAVEALEAGLLLVHDLGLSVNEDKIYNIGYSQGGQMALANLRYVSTNSDTGISFYKTFAGSGVYDPSLTMREYATDAYPKAVPLAVFGLVSMVAQAGDSVNPEEVYREPLLSTYKELYLSKKYDIAQIRTIFGDAEFSEVITDGVLNMTSDAGITLNQMALRQRVYGGWILPEGMTLYLFGSEDDDYVPYSNYVAAKYFLEDTSPDADMHFLSMPTGGHVTGIIPFILWMKENWE